MERSAAGVVTVEAGQVTDGIDLATRLGGVVTGKVINAWNEYPIYPGWVRARPAGMWAGDWSYRIDTDGTYRIGGLSGAYQLTVSQERYLLYDSEPFSIGPGEKLTIDIALTPAEGTPYATISGVACEAESAATGCWIPDPEDGTTMIPLMGVTVEARNPEGKLLGTTTTDMSGWFMLEELIPGTIVVTMPEAPAGMETLEPLTYTLAYDEYVWDAELMAQRVGVHLVLESWLTQGEPEVSQETEFHLEAVFASTQESVDPFDVTGVTVSVFLPDGLEYVTHSGDGPFDPGSGIWTIPELPYLGRAEMTIVLDAGAEGVFRPHAEVASSDWPDPGAVFGDGRGDDFTSQRVEVSPVEVPTVEEAVIGGRVWRDANDDGIRDDDEAGLAEVTVIAIGEAGTSRSVVTGSDGSYRMTELAEGSYQVVLDEETLPDDVVAPEGLAVTLGPETVLTDTDFACVEVTPPFAWWIVGLGAAVLVGALGITWLLLGRRRMQVPVPTDPVAEKTTV